jgi:poly [ADP-ribose] polymerase
MGILGSGLMIKPGSVDFTGSMFGDGIYFADTFDKSINYCNDWNFFGLE